MHWLDQFDSARRGGRHAFLFVGAVGDGFPLPQWDGNAPFDALEPWVTAISCHVANGALRCVYDPIRGFVFPKPEDELRFRALALGEQPAPSNDPIVRARQQLQERQELPRAPLDAVRCIRAVVDRAATLQPIVPIIVVLPDVDAIAPAGTGSVRPDAGYTALALAQLASDDAVRRAGHLVLMSAATAASVDERLRRPDSGIAVITVGKPTENERRTFLEACCEADAPAATPVEDPQQAVEEERRALRNRLTNDRALQPQTLTDAVWCAVRRGDAIRTTIRDGATIEGSVDHVVRAVCKDPQSKQHLAEFALATDPTKPFEQQGQGVQFKFQDGTLHAFVSGSDGWQPFTDRDILELVSAERLTLERRLAEIESAAEPEAPIPELPPRKFPTPAAGIAETVRLTRGLGYRDLATLLRDADAHGRALDLAEVTARRRELLQRSYSALYRIIEPTFDFDGIAGYAYLKVEFARIARAMRAGDVRRIPQGMMFMGPPGTGKTAFAEAIAAACGLLMLAPKSPRSMWVGESERQSEEQMQALVDLAPVLVFRDEVDEEDSGRDSFQGDSGVSARIRRNWMEFLADERHQGRILVISATNRPDRLDAALKRTGRTSVRVPFLLPDHVMRAALFPLFVRRDGFATTVTDFAPFADATDGYSGADIREIVRTADALAHAAGKDAIDADAFRAAIADFIPNAESARYAMMTLRAIAECSSRRLLPPNIEEVIRNARAALAGTHGTAMTVGDVLAGVPVDPSKN